MQNTWQRLEKGIVLAELGGYGDGPYCARYGAGAALAMMGTYIVDAGDAVSYPKAFVFKPGRESYAGYLQEHIQAARVGGAAVGVSVICVDPQDDIDFLVAAEQAGADYVSLCLHSTMPMFTSRGLSSAMLTRAHWPALREHLRAVLSAVRAPFIAKVGVDDTADALDAVGVMVEQGVRIVHANVGDAVDARGRELIGELKRVTPFLIAGGGVATADDARRVLDAGADAVAIGTAAMSDPDLCGRVQAALRGM